MAVLSTAEREALLQRAIVIRDEIMHKANTANRVGSLFYDIVRFLAAMDLDELRQYFLRKDVDDETLHVLSMAEAWVKGDLNVEGADEAFHYIRFGMKTRVWDNLYVHAACKTHLHIAEYVEFGLGYQIPFLKKGLRNGDSRIFHYKKNWWK